MKKKPTYKYGIDAAITLDTEFPRAGVKKIVETALEAAKTKGFKVVKARVRNVER